MLRRPPRSTRTDTLFPSTTLFRSGGTYDLEVYGPNGYFRKFAGNIHETEPEIQLDYDHRKGGISIELEHQSVTPFAVELVGNAYGYPPMETITDRQSTRLHSSH